MPRPFSAFFLRSFHSRLHVLHLSILPLSKWHCIFGLLPPWTVLQLARVSRQLCRLASSFQLWHNLRDFQVLAMATSCPFPVSTRLEYVELLGAYLRDVKMERLQEPPYCTPSTNLARCVAQGRSGVGKTALLQTLTYGHFRRPRPPSMTHCWPHQFIHSNGTPINLWLCDTGE